MSTVSTEKPRVLLVDDEDFVGAALKAILGEKYELIYAQSAPAAMKYLYNDSAEAVLLDLNLPGITGLEFLKVLRQRYPSAAVIMLTGNSDPRSVVAAMKAGASDYVVKGTQEFESELRVRLEQAIERSSEKKRLEAKIADHARSFDIVGHSAATLKLRSEIIGLRPFHSTVLITGPSGTGKELVARNLNYQGPDKSRPFIEVNCGAIAENLIESELFGHEKGAFTHAIQKQEGKFLAANNGDIFLDEIGELPLHLQPKLLRVLENRTVTPVGSTKAIPINVRVIAATNRDLAKEVREGRFREDLYYRLAVSQVDVPALKERLDDIPALVTHFLKSFGACNITLSKASISLLMQHSWPGNIRALKNCLERAWIKSQMLGKAVIDPEMLRFDDVTFSEEQLVSNLPYLPQESGEISPAQFQSHMSWAEKEYIVKSYELTKHNKTVLASKLGLNRDTIYRKFRHLGIDLPTDKTEASY